MRKKLTNEKHLNLFKDENNWIFASRTDLPSEYPNAIVIAAVKKDESDGILKLVITREYRAPLRDYEYGLPAGLIEDGESIEDCARRELKEETGLDLTNIIDVFPQTWNSSGLSDESIHIVLCNCVGNISNANLQDSEDIETLLYTKDDEFPRYSKIATNALLILCMFKLISWSKK